MRKDFRSGVRSQVQNAFPPYCACLNACLARCFSQKYPRTVLVSLVLNRDGKFQLLSVPGCAADAAGSPREPSGRGAARPGCRGRADGGRGGQEPAVQGRIPPTAADFGEEGEMRKLPPRTVRRPSGFQPEACN